MPTSLSRAGLGTAHPQLVNFFPDVFFNMFLHIVKWEILLCVFDKFTKVGSPGVLGTLGSDVTLSS